MNVKEIFKFLISSFVMSLLIVACSTKTTVTEKKLSKDAWGNDLPFSVGKDADGNPVMQSDKRSHFEKKAASLGANKDFRGRDYTTTSYRKKRWGGHTSYNTKKYQGKIKADLYHKEPWYVRKQVASAQKVAPSSKKKFTWNPFKTKTAAAQSMQRYEVHRDASVEKRRKVYKQPEITNWKDQQGLTVKDTNSMLGR